MAAASFAAAPDGRHIVTLASLTQMAEGYLQPDDIRRIREARKARAVKGVGEPKTILLLPGSRGSEITQLLPVFGEAMKEFVARNGETRFVLPTVARQEARVRDMTRDWTLRPDILVGDEGKWRAFEEADAAIAALTGLKGVGPWTAEVYLMFCGGHPDIFPVGDVALRISVGDVFFAGERPLPEQVAELAEAWAPVRSVAARLFWAHYARITGRVALPR